MSRVPVIWLLLGGDRSVRNSAYRGEAARLPVRDREVVIERPDGSRATVLANVAPLFDSAGEIVGGVNCFQDITELKRSQEALREREQWYRGLLEALPAAVYTTDAGGRITFYNQAAVKLAGRLPTLGSQWCVTWRLLGPTARPCRMRNAPWRWRSRNSGRCGASRRWPSAPMARAFPSYPIRRRFTT